MSDELRYRQSTLSSLETCGRRTWFQLQTPDLNTGYTGSSADLGSLCHAVLAECLRTMKAQGHGRIPTQEAIEIAYETAAKESIVLPADERESLRVLVLNFCEIDWTPISRILAIEERLTADLQCLDGKTRCFSGQPDVILSDAPNGLIIPDWKTGKAKPKDPRKPPPEGEPIVGKKYLSERGHFQLDSYGLLALYRYPTAEYVTLREYHLRYKKIREAVLYRHEVEHVERELAGQMEKLDQGLAEGVEAEVWSPKAGKQCAKQCPVAMSCPIPKEQRGDGAIETQDDANEAAEAFTVVDAQRQQLRTRLKAWREADNPPAVVGDGRVMDIRDGRFGMYEP